MQRVFKEIGDVKLHMHIKLPAGHKSDDQRAAIIFFYGGGYEGGTVQQFIQHAEYFADQGLVAMCAEYRVFNRHKTTPFEAIADGRSAVRWLREHAKTLGVDPSRICAAGGSAGGHLALCISMLPEKGHNDDKFSAVPNALVLFNPVVDTTTVEEVAKRFFGRAAEASPIEYVRPGLPPAIIYHGTADQIAPYEDTVRFTELMKKQGNACELITFEGMDHGFFNVKWQETNGMYKKTLQLTEDFLISLQYLSGSSFK